MTTFLLTFIACQVVWGNWMLGSILNELRRR